MKRLRLVTVTKGPLVETHFNRVMEELIEKEVAEVQSINMSDEKVIYIFYTLKEESE